jgi:hypothetical protein
MYFIVELPLFNGCLQIWVIIDRFTKMAHFIPFKDTKKKSKDLALIFVRNIWWLHGFPTEIITDQDRRFTIDLRSSLCELLGIHQKISTSFQPETDYQTERVTQTIEAFVRSFYSYEQNDWYDVFPLAEHTYNNSITTATGYSAFYANYSFNLRSDWLTHMEPKNPNLSLYAHWI